MTSPDNQTGITLHDLSSAKTLHEGVPEAPDIHSEQEGGPLGVRAVIGASGITFCTWGFVGSISVFQSHYEEYTLSSYSSSDISWISSVQLACVYLTGSIAGNLHDKGYMRHLILFSCLVSALGFMLASISTQYWHYILSQGLVLGLGLGTAFTPSVACVSSYYKKSRGLANGLLSSGSAIGGLILPIMLSKMLNNPKIGLGWAHRTCGFICFVVFGMAWILMRQKKVTNPVKRPLLDFTVFKQVAYDFTVAGLFMITMGIFYPVFYIQSLGVSKGVNADLVFYSVAILNGSSLIGRIAPLMVADRIGPSNVIVACIAMSCILIYSFAGLQNFGGIVGFSVLNGIAYGCYVTINPVVIAGLVDDPARIGTHIGMAYIANAIAGVAGPPALGAVINKTGGYWQGAIIAGSFVLIGGVLLTIANYLTRKKKGTWRV